MISTSSLCWCYDSSCLGAPLVAVEGRKGIKLLSCWTSACISGLYEPQAGLSSSPGLREVKDVVGLWL